VYTEVMLNKDQVAMLMFLKNKSKSNQLVSTKLENVFFAFTSKAVEDVLLNKYKSFVKNGVWKRLRCILGEGLFTTEEPRHMIDKKEIFPAFHSDKTKEYENKVSGIVDFSLQNWSEKVNVRKEMQFLVFKITMEVFFSKNIDSDFVKIRDNISLSSDIVLSDASDEELVILTKDLKDYVKKIVDERLESKENKNDLLDTLIKSYNNKKMNIDDLYDHAVTIIFSGYESTAYFLEWAVYYLSINKKWQDKISKEEDVDAFINEVLRMCPPVWNTERIATEDVNVDGTDLTAGTKVIVSSLAMHKDKNIFKDPDSFSPERWLENKDLAKGEYFPFLFGKRQCIAKDFVLMETRLILTKIAKKFDVELINDTVSYLGALTYRPKDEIKIYVKNK
jgi:cytochrome P450